MTITARFFERFDLPEESQRFSSRQNISPGQVSPVILELDGRRLVDMQWGLVPPWVKDPKIGSKMFNARCETLQERSAFKHPLKRKRCLVPASGFYEWKREESGKVPYLIRPKGEDFFAMAGLYDVWQSGDGSVLSTFTIITTPSSRAMADLHDRMPAILSRDTENEWTAPGELDAGLIAEIIHPYELQMSITPASASMNRPAVRDDSVQTKLW